MKFLLHFCQLFSILAAAQIYRLFILHQVSAPNEKKERKNHIQVNDKRHTIGDMTSEWSIKCPLGSMVLEKGEKEKQKHKKKKKNIFLCKKRAALYSVAITAFLSNTHTHSFILVLLISNTSVKCSPYIYLYIMKELKMCFFFPRTIYSIMNSNRHENINIIMTQTSQRNYPQF